MIFVEDNEVCKTSIGHQLLLPCACNGDLAFLLNCALTSQLFIKKKTDSRIFIKGIGFTKLISAQINGILVGPNPPNLCPVKQNWLCGIDTYI